MFVKGLKSKMRFAHGGNRIKIYGAGETELPPEVAALAREMGLLDDNASEEDEGWISDDEVERQRAEKLANGHSTPASNGIKRAGKRRSKRAGH